MMRRRAFLSALAAGLAHTGPPAALPAPARLGRLLCVGALQNRILVLDEEQEKVVGAITLATSVPRSLLLSNDKQKIFVLTVGRSGIEVVDVAARKVTNHFVLDEPSRRFWFRGFAADPQDRLLYTVMTARNKQIDRFEIDKPKFAVIDLARQKIIKAVDYPRQESSAFLAGSLRVSPDGRFLYHFRENLLIFDTGDFKLVEKIELSKPPSPQYPGMESINLGPGDDPNDEPGIVTAIFNSTDPVVHRKIFGIARIDLARRTVDYSPVGPSTTSMYPLRLTPDRKKGYTVASYDSLGNRRSEFWVFDMATKKIVTAAEFPAPTSFRFTLSPSGKTVYIYGSSPFMDVYDAATLKLRNRLDLNADLTTMLLPVPA
jgi:hypothetical protein